MGYKSIVSRANKNSPSVRTTIPEKVVEQAKINPGDVLDWETLVDKGKTTMKVRKME